MKGALLRISIAALLAHASAAWASGQAMPRSEDCVRCHLESDDARIREPAVRYESDVHAAAGFGCLACHGTGGFDALDPAMGFLSAPTRTEVPALCGRCHSDPIFMRDFDPGMRVDQVFEYWTSRHGIRLREVGDTAVATCSDCHPAHDIRPPSDPESSVFPTNVVETCGACHGDPERMAGRGLDTNQHDDYLASVHGQMLIEEGDLSSPVCNDCHGNHGAAPPGLASVRNVCGQCHSVMAEFFDESDHEPIFEEAGLPGCAACHDDHLIERVSDASLGDRSERVCRQCHEPGDEAYGEFDRMAVALDSFEAAVELSAQRLEEAHDLGMEVSAAQFALEDANNARVRAHSAIHAFRVEPVLEQLEPGFEIAETAQEEGTAALDEHRFRRIGLGAFSVIVVLLTIAIVGRIRVIDERVEAALDSAERFYRQSLAGAGAAPGSRELRLAACTLLVEAAFADETFSQEERDHLGVLIAERFDLTPVEARELLELTERQREAGVDIGQVARLINEHYDVEQKESLVSEIWGLVYSDEDLEKRELAFVQDIANMLGLEAERVAELGRVAMTANGSSNSKEDA